ncbi:MAG: HEAT repeat domain-containing protein, partial [Planctomycetota bacterium]
MQGPWKATVIAALLAGGCAATGDDGPPPLPQRDLDPKLAEIAVLELAKDRAGRLQELLNDADAEVRLAAVRALAHIRHAGDADALAGRFGDDDLRVVRAALFASGLLRTAKERAAAAPLLPLLDHADTGVRAAAVEALGRIGDHTTLEQLLARLRDADPLVRGEAALACWRMQQGAAKVDPETPDPEAEAVARRIHASVLPVARKAGNEPDATARWKMCYAVAALRRTPARGGPDPVALPGKEAAELRTLVRTRLNDSDAVVRGYAALAAGRLWEAEAGPLLTPLLGDADWNVQVWALRGLAKAEDEATVAAIRALAANAAAHAQVRRSALESLARRRDAGSEEVVVAALDAGAPAVQRAAMAAWAKLKGADALPALQRALRDEDPWTRAAAIAAVGATLAPPETEEGEEPPAPDEGHVKQVADLLQARLTDGDDYDRAAVMAACSDVPVDLACELLKQGCRIGVLEVRGSACSVIQARAKAISESGRDLVPDLNAAWNDSQEASDYELRQEIIKAFAALGVKRAIPLLRTALDEDPHAAVRKAAAEALTKLG